MATSNPTTSSTATPSPTPIQMAGASATTPGTTSSSGVSTAASVGSTKVLEKLADYAMANPIAVLSTAVLSTGGGMLLVFFDSLNHLPDLDLQSSTTLLYAVALLGLVAITLASGFLLLPGFVIAVAVGSWDSLDTAERRAISLSAAVPAGIWALLFHAVEGSHACDAALWVLSVVFVLSIAWIRWIPFPARRPLGWLACSGTLVLSVLLGGLFLMLLRAAEPAIAGSHFGATLGKWMALIMILGVCIFLWVLVGMDGPEDAAKLGLILGPVVLLFMLQLTGTTSGLSRYVIKRLGMGEMDAVRVVVTGKGCKQINQALGTTVCKEVADDAPTTICPASLRSRIGTQVILEFAPMHTDGPTLVWTRPAAASGAAGKTASPSPRRVVMDKAELKSWTILPEVREAPAKEGEKVARLAAATQASNDRPLARQISAYCSPWAASVVETAPKGKGKSGG